MTGHPPKVRRSMRNNFYIFSLDFSSYRDIGPHSGSPTSRHQRDFRPNNERTWTATNGIHCGKSRVDARPTASSASPMETINGSGCHHGWRPPNWFSPSGEKKNQHNRLQRRKRIWHPFISLYTCKCSMKLTPAHSRTVNWILIWLLGGIIL